MGETAKAIGRCLEAGNEERAIGYVKTLESSGSFNDLAQLRALEGSAPTRLRYYIRKAIRALERRLEPAPAPRAQTPPSAMRALPPATEPGPAAADPGRLAAHFGECVNRTPGRRMPDQRGELPESPLERIELAALASHLDDCIARTPAQRLAASRRDPDPLNRIAVDRLADLFRTLVDDRPGLRFGGPEPSDVAAAPIASALREIAAEQAALAEIEFAQFDLDPALFNRLDRAIDAAGIAV